MKYFYLILMTLFFCAGCVQPSFKVPVYNEHKPLELHVITSYSIHYTKLYEGNNWPSFMRRWCTREKMNALHKYLKSIPGAVSCVGLAADETGRLETSDAKSRKITCRYPLIEYGMTEAQALQYCYDKGYTWNGLYQIFNRVSYNFV